MQKTDGKIYKYSFEVNNHLKTYFLLFVSVFYLVFACLFLFQIPSADLWSYISENLVSVFWVAMFFSLTIANAHFHLKNIQKESFYLRVKGFLFPVVMTLLFFAYEFVLFFCFFPQNPAPEWFDFFQFLRFYAVSLGLNTLWKQVFVFSKYKTEPCATNKNVFSFVTSLVFLSYLLLGTFFLDKFLVKEQVFVLQDNDVIIPLIYIGVSFSGLVYLAWKYFQFRKLKVRFKKDGVYNKVKKSKNQDDSLIFFYKTFLKVSPVIIWLLSVENVFDQINSLFEYLYVGFNCLLTLVLIWFGFLLKIKRKLHESFLLVFTVSIFLSSLAFFVLSRYTSTTILALTMVFLTTCLLQVLLGIFFKIKASYFYQLTFSLFVNFTVAYVFLNFVIYYGLNLEITYVPFNVKDVLEVVWFAFAGFLLISNILLTIVDFGRINSSTSWLMKDKINKKSAKRKTKKKGVKSVQAK